MENHKLTSFHYKKQNTPNSLHCGFSSVSFRQERPSAIVAQIDSIPTTNIKLSDNFSYTIKKTIYNHRHMLSVQNKLNECHVTNYISSSIITNGDGTYPPP